MAFDKACAAFSVALLEVEPTCLAKYVTMRLREGRFLSIYEFPIALAAPMEAREKPPFFGFGKIGVGRFFVLIEAEGGAGLGPEVSLRAGAIVRTGGRDMDVLASTRPHLVSDPGIQERLAAIGLPAGAHRDRLVLLLTKSFDSLLWETIRESLSEKRLALNDIARVMGAYEEGPNGVFLRLDAAVARADGREYPLHGKLRVSL